MGAGNGDVTITNDGATILKQMEVIHPAARMLVELSKAQDIEAGDGTTSVCVMAGSLLKAANTSLNSKVVSQNSAELSPIAVDAVLKIIDPARENNVNLKDIKIIKKLGGTVDDTELVDGMVFEQKAANINGPKKIEKAKIVLLG